MPASSIARFRKRAHMLQRELAKEVGVTVLTVKNWEHGRRRPDRQHLALLGQVLGLTLKEREDLTRKLAGDQV